jgi:hypothetical protein
MLRVTVHKDATRCRLELAGRLDGPWVAETEKAWGSELCSGKPIQVDIREVTGVGEAGRVLLAAMHEAGADLIARGVEMTALVQEIRGEITRKQPFDGARRQLQKKNFSAGQFSRIRRDK